MFILLGIFERKRNWIVLTSAAMSLCLIITCAGILIQFQKQKDKLNLTFKPIENWVSESYEVQSQCDQIKTITAHLLDKYPDLIIQTREDFQDAIQSIQQYPTSKSDFKTLFSQYQDVPSGLAETLVLKKIIHVYTCNIVSQLDLRRLLITTAAKKPNFLTNEDTLRIRKEILLSLKKSSETLGYFFKSLSDAETLQILSDTGLIPNHYRAEILELNRDSTQTMQTFRRNYFIYGFRMPSPEQTHFIYESIRHEFRNSDEVQTRVRKIVNRILNNSI
jgi:hypothetical protein